MRLKKIMCGKIKRTERRLRDNQFIITEESFGELKKELRELNDYKKEVMELKRQIRVLETQKENKPIGKNGREHYERLMKKAEEHGYKDAERRKNEEISSLTKAYKILEKKLIDLGKVLGSEYIRLENKRKDWKPV